MKGKTAPQPDPVRLAAVPRDVRLTANGKAVAAVAIVLAAASVAAAIGLSLLHVRQEQARQLRLREAVHAEATVTRVARTREEHPRSVVTYRYRAPDGIYERSARLPERDRRPMAEGDRLAVAYLRSQPGHSWVEGDEAGVFPLWAVPLLSALLLAISSLIALTVRRERMLLAEGRVAEARILSTHKVHRHDHHAYRIEYEFTTLGGTTVKSRTDRRRVPGGTGATVAVVYHRDNPRWNAIYPLTLVAPAPK